MKDLVSEEERFRNCYKELKQLPCITEQEECLVREFLEPEGREELGPEDAIVVEVQTRTHYREQARAQVDQVWLAS